MDSEQAINTADFFLREVPNVKISTELVVKKNVVKEELQFLRLKDSVQEEVLETLKYIHGPDFRLNDVSSYAEAKSNILKKYWVGQGSLVVKGGCDFSQNKDEPTVELDRLRQFALLRLESYGFHKTHCSEAFNYCKGDIEDALYLLYSKYFNFSSRQKEIDHGLSEKELLEQRNDEKSSVESIYESSFKAKVDNVWILTLKLDYLVRIFHKKKEKEVRNNVQKVKKEKCRNFLRGHCKFGSKCRFSHEVEEKVVVVDSHINNYDFELEFRFPSNTNYPYEPPLIFLKTNAVLPPLVNLHLCKRLYEEAKLLAEDGIPCVYTITELLQNEDEMKEQLNKEMNFLSANEKLLSLQRAKEVRRLRPSHYKKGVTNRDNKRTLTLDQLVVEDRKLVDSYLSKLNQEPYLRMLQARKNLPSWESRHDILNTINQSQVVVISGETGCGKSTQVPQFVLDEWMNSYKNEKKHIEIVCTQPRRISAIGVAERVAAERVDKIGNLVGYQIRLENKVSINTRLTFCTTGILLRRLEGEPTLPNVTHILVDEVHERSEESDFLLLILKELLPIRPDLKVILMSATLNASLFSKYFGEVPVLNIPGWTYPVQQLFLEDILERTSYVLEEGGEYCRRVKLDSEFDKLSAEGELSYGNAMPKENVKDEGLKIEQVMARYHDYSMKTCKNLYLMDPDKINNELIETILEWIITAQHKFPKKWGTILVFLPGIAEITSLFDQLKDHKLFGERARKFVILPLHSSLTNEEQAAIFAKPKDGQRKIVLSTNLAETSITIDDCVYVIDSGKMKEKHFDPNRNMESLETVWVTRANALQRKGRAGRATPGMCVHLYTSHRFKHHMLPQPIPEINRIPLEQLILKIKVLPSFEEREVTNVIGSFIEPPSEENVLTAMKRLENVGALDKDENLTPLGHHLAALPVDVRIGKLMLYGAIFGCVDDALTMAACLSYKNPFVTPFRLKELANKKKQAFAAGYSDQITVLFAYKKFLQVYKKSMPGGRNFANENFLSYRTLITIADIKHQFLEYLIDIGFVSVNLEGRRPMGQDKVYEITGSEFNKNGENIRLLTSILCAALYPNVIKILTPSKSYVMSIAGAVPKQIEAKELKFATAQEAVFMHPSSVNYSLKHFPSPYLVYQEKVRTSKVYFRECTMVPVVPLVLFSGYDLNITVQNGNTFIGLEDGWILFQVEEHQVAEMVKLIRQELFDLLEEKINDPLLNLQHHDKGEKIIAVILNLINS